MSDYEHPYNALPQGYRLQEYELVRVLGSGGFGITYLAFDHHLDEAVAIKEYLPSDLATRTADGSVAPQASQFRADFQGGRSNFLNEALTLARFDHHHIIKVHRLVEAHGTAYIVMEYAEGETLAAYLKRKGTLAEAELTELLYPLLDGLAVVHETGILHRDIKPANIVIRDEDSSPVLLDFGAARQDVRAKTRSLSVIVTPGYAPIEQYSRRGRQGTWTDIYALGAVCYRALTGEVPEDATDRVRDDPLVAVSQRCAGQARGAFLSAIDAALLVDEGDRPQSVEAWRGALSGQGDASGRASGSSLGPRRKSEQVVSLPGGAEMAFVWIEPGVFQMGLPESYLDREGPVHEVEISQGFYMGTYEVTQGQWEAVMEETPWSGRDYVQANPSHPAEYISWNDVQRFIEKLNDAAGDSLYRLPTEAEWEYACRAGTTTRWSFGDDESELTHYAWYEDNAWDVGEAYAHAVGTKLPNPWGLYDMHGNVYEWVQDVALSYRTLPRVDPLEDPPGPAFNSADRGLRGGAFNSAARLLWSARRASFPPVVRNAGLGVRLLRIR